MRLGITTLDSVKRGLGCRTGKADAQDSDVGQRQRQVPAGPSWPGHEGSGPALGHRLSKDPRDSCVPG